MADMLPHPFIRVFQLFLFSFIKVVPNHSVTVEILDLSGEHFSRFPASLCDLPRQHLQIWFISIPRQVTSTDAVWTCLVLHCNVVRQYKSFLFSDNKYPGVVSGGK